MAIGALICKANCQFAMNEWHTTRTQTDSLRYKIKLGYQILKEVEV